jgi:ribosomal protein S18 acetylase RimI-like enzyme
MYAHDAEGPWRTVVVAREIYLAKSKEDFEGLTEIHKECFGKVDWDEYKKALGDKRCFFVVAKEKEEIVGYLAARVEGECAKGLWQGTKESHRRMGIGKPVHQEALEESSRRGAEYFDSFLTEENDMFAAISGQQKQLGFIPIARYPDHYIKDGEKVNIMISHLRISLMPLKKSDGETATRE